MEWTQILFCLLLTISCLIPVKAETTKNVFPKEENNPSKQNKGVSNKTKAYEVLEESPSERIKFRKPVIFKEGIDISSSKKATSNNKDLIKEENRFSPTLTFSGPSTERYWKVIDLPPYRGQTEYRHPEPKTESHVLVHKPVHSPEVLNYTPSPEPNYPSAERSEERPVTDSQYQDYSGDSYGPSPNYPETRTHSHPQTNVHTETTHDFGKFLPVDYRSKIEKEAEEMVKSKTTQNSTDSRRPVPYNRGNRPVPLKQNDYQPATRSFFHLGNYQGPNTYHPPKVLNYSHSDKYRYTSEENPSTKHTSPQHYPYTRENIPPNQIHHHSPRRPFTSTETYPRDISETSKHLCPNHRNPNAPNNYDVSTERYPSTYSTPSEGQTYPKTLMEHSPKHYSSSTEQYQPQHNSNEQTYPTPYSSDHSPPTEYSQREIPDTEKKHYHFKEGNYSPHTDHIYPPSTESPKPLSMNPNLPVSQPHFLHHDPPPNQPYTGDTDFTHEKVYQNTYESLYDLYRSYGFNPLDLRVVSEMFDPRFHFGSQFRAKIPISDLSREYHVSNFKVPEFIEHINSKPDHDSYGSHPALPGGIIHNSKQNGQRNIRFIPVLEQNPIMHKQREPYHSEQVPYDSKQAPIVSNEYYDSEISKPATFNTQLETRLKDSVSQEQFRTELNHPTHSIDGRLLDNAKTLPIQIKDINADNAFRNPSQNTERSLESDMPSNTPHSIVRDNPYQITSNSNEYGNRRYKERPRVYRNQNVMIHSEEQNRYKTNIIDTSRDVILSDSSTISDTHSYTLQNEKDHKQTMPKKGEQSADHERENTSNNQRKKSNKKDRVHTRERKVQDDFTHHHDQRSSQNEKSKTHSKKHGKRSSHKRPKKHKHHKRSQRSDQLHAAESTSDHWGMENHKDKNGFFQYANVPGVKAFEYGYRMGGPDHTEERHHSTKGIQSKIKVNWKDKNGDSGDHYWEFNHSSNENNEE